MERNILMHYEQWRKFATEDDDIIQDLEEMSNDTTQINEAFYCDLSFGTAGLRGVLGAGTNRINIYTVARVSQGLSSYVNNNKKGKQGVVAIAYDSRIKSDLFAEIAARVFAANGIVTYLFNELMPTPCLSYAVRALGCDSGVVITASHNPSNYNGYKVYGSNGCQITEQATSEISTEIEKVDIFNDVKMLNLNQGIDKGYIKFISENIYTDFISAVKKQSLLSDEDEVDKDIAIIYSPLNGTGLKPVIRVLKESGYTNISVVKEQELPDGSFPTCPYPNPESKDAMELGISYAKKKNADLLVATDPDCDRVGIAVKNAEGEYTLLTGNEVGILMLDYICLMRIKNGTMPEEPIFIKTIVSSNMTEQIAQHYNVKVKNVLPGFKYIGEQIGHLEEGGKENSFIFGFEESFGYLTGVYVRDKDAVGGVLTICEMAAFYKKRGVNLLDRLNELYNTFGYFMNNVISYQFDGAIGMKRMNNLISKFRFEIDSIACIKVLKKIDYLEGVNDLPKADVIELKLVDDNSVIIRASGTEPKIKIYLLLKEENQHEVRVKADSIKNCIEEIVCAYSC